MDNKTLRVVVLPIDGFALMSLASAIEPMRAANLFAGREVFRLSYMTAEGGPARSSAGAIVPADTAFVDIADVDLALVVAGGDPLNIEIDETLSWLRQRARLGVRIGGVSGGPVVLARAGLMSGRRMTVHWEHAQELSETYPDLLIERSLYVVDRDRITCAGGTAALDMMHALIAERLGVAFARRVSDWFMHTEIRASADPQRAGGGERYGTANMNVSAAIEVMENHIADPVDLGQLALLVGLSPRHLNRLFIQELKTSAMAFYRQLRLEIAAKLLTRSTLSINAIAEATGFASPSHFSAAFARHYDKPPARWQRGIGRQPESESAS